MPRLLLIDFESRGSVDLMRVGADSYLDDDETQPLCLCAIEMDTDDKITTDWTWRPADGSLNWELVEAIEEADFVVAHNARFDRGLWENCVDDYGFPDIPEHKWYCSSAQCRVNALPAGLDNAARAINPKYRKDHRGSALIRECSIPPFNEDPELLRQMSEYCMQDVKLTEHIIRSTRLMTEEEHTDWLVSERINDRGVCIDRELCQLAVRYAAQEAEEIAELLTEITSGEITKHTQHQRVKKWIKHRLDDYDPTCTDSGIDPLKLITRWKSGEKKISTDKAARATLLAAHDSHEIELPPDVVELIELVDDGSRSSVSKFQRMLDMANPDTDRVTGAFLYAGAGQTKRFSARGLQVHNFPRDCFKPHEVDALFDKMARGEPLDNCMKTLSRLLRSAIWPDEGEVFIVGDWSAIEARALPWLSGDARADRVLDVFRGDGKIYEHTASGMFNIPISEIDEDSLERFLGKVATLALGYQGAIGAFSSMARNYGKYLPEHEVKDIVHRWRTANPWAVDFWAALERAAKQAVANPGTSFPAGRVQYVYTPHLLDGTLFCVLPDGSTIQYGRVRMEHVETAYGIKPTLTYLKASLTAEADAKEWPRSGLYGGLLAENVTQAFCACLLRRALRKLDDVCLHVHDEIVLEVPEEVAEEKCRQLQEVMEDVPEWAEGLPLKAKPSIMYRYGK